MELRQFACWADVLAHVSGGKAVYYQGPLDHRPVGPFRLKNHTLEVRDNTLRFVPWSAMETDPFIADDAHLSRIWKEAT